MPAFLPRTGPSNTSQRVKVGVIGIAVVLILIALAAAVLRTVTRERAVLAPGGAKPEMVANMALGNDAAASAGLADMGVSPGINNDTATPR